ncbi:hypothetical protein K432DRAFT_418582 [Lepidopterella palustris CBS 459.81]|uniref:Uncharacterized protein n=1 Tax=Lepidopterella palustris CBS 459.81 TaxID=1314670 RepID=A0A8E2E5F0_9PEZI|nr:hypothetical protein K432DRAFT_418582 [Lepidopterella palustris CBS 459.81]
MRRGGAQCVSLDAAGLVVFANLSTIGQRTALTGSSTLLDALFLCPGIHRQQNATNMNGSEYPAAAAMTSGYVFLAEGQATLTTVSIAPVQESKYLFCRFLSKFLAVGNATWISCIAYLATVLMTLAVLVLVNVIVIRRRCQVGWESAPELEANGDLLVLLTVDDFEALTSGQWLRDMTRLVLFIASGGLLAVVNALIDILQMHNRTLRVTGTRSSYRRRLDPADDLIKELGHDDWTMSVGMIKKDGDTGGPHIM